MRPKKKTTQLVSLLMMSIIWKVHNSEDVHMSSVSASAHYLRTSFGLMDDVLNQIHTEVTAVLRTLALERKDVLSTKAAVTFTSTLLDDLLDQINSTFTDLFVYANSPHGSPLTAKTEKRGGTHDHPI
ncbi:hypothetical protein AOLI_G00324170 [Acnodon oligacanthus]